MMSTSYKMPRKWDKEHCESKSCDEMGFSEKASCRPYVNCYGDKTGSKEQDMISKLSAKRDDPKMKNTGHGGLDTWFAGHGGGKPDDRATWGDWIAVTPVKHTVKKENGESKTYEPGDIVGPCAVSSEPEWSSVTDGGKDPLKCMPRDKAHDLTKEQRATLARKKRREESKGRNTQKPVLTPTFSEKGKDMLKKADFYREVTPPDQLSSLTQGTPIGRSDNPDGTNPHSALPNGDSARNIGRPSPDSPNLKYRNLDRAEANGRTPAEGQDFGYVHDSGSGSARVIPYDSGFANNGSALRKAGLIRPPQHLVEELTEVAKGALAEYLFEMEGRKSSPYNSTDLDTLEGFAEDLAYLPKGIKRGEESLSDVIFEFKSAKSYLNSLKKRITDEDSLAKINEALSIVSALDPQDFFENAGLYKETLRDVSDLFEGLFENAKSFSGLKLITPYAREKYEEALQKNAHRSKISRFGYSWRVSDPALSHPLYVEVRFTSPLRANGSYGFGKTAHVITFYFDSEKTTWGVFELNKVEDVARHELVHLMQKEIAIQRHLSKPNVSPREYVDTGLPRSKYDKTFRQPNIHDQSDVLSAKELLKSMQAQYRAEGLDPSLISIHALDDIEFYSRLLDEVVKFRKGYPQPRNKDIRSFMDRSQFFQSLKRYKPRNWKKAVGIFVSEVV